MSNQIIGQKKSSVKKSHFHVVGPVPTLRFTSGAGSYTLIDRATYLSIQKEIKLEILVEGDEALLNRISLIPVSQKKFPQVNSEDVALFVNWLSSPAKGQKIVAEFGKERFGAALFFPDSKEWHLQQKP
jgi:tungstate transport system substrate-binding protein